jgi:hypothetical protein
MQPLRRNANPFALMIDPQAVLAQIENSERLERLQRRVCRPLDKPLLGVVGEGDDGAEMAPAARSGRLDDGADVRLDLDLDRDAA